MSRSFAPNPSFQARVDRLFADLGVATQEQRDAVLRIERLTSALEIGATASPHVATVADRTERQGLPQDA